MKVVRKYHVELVRESSMRYNIDTKIDSSKRAPEILREVLDIEKWHNEKFGLMALNSQNELIGLHIVSEGTLNETAVYSREIATRALLNNANSVIIFHNHPGNSPTPSHSDMEATRKVKAGLETIGIKLLDHIILTDTEYTSFAEKGLL